MTNISSVYDIQAQMITFRVLWKSIQFQTSFQRYKIYKCKNIKNSCWVVLYTLYSIYYTLCVWSGFTLTLTHWATTWTRLCVQGTCDTRYYLFTKGFRYHPNMFYCEIHVRKAKVKTWQKKKQKRPTFFKGVSLIQRLLWNKVTAGKNKTSHCQVTLGCN